MKVNLLRYIWKRRAHLFTRFLGSICLWILPWALSNGIKLETSPVLAQSALPIATPSAPKLYDTLRIIHHPQGTEQALTYLLSRSPQELSMMKTNALKKALSALACPELDQLNDHPHLIYQALQALTIFQRIGELSVEGECLGKLWRGTLTPHRIMYGQLRQDLLARSAVQTLHQIGRVDLLIGALKHPDPHIRALVARSGINPHRLCELHTDVWSEVRLGAVRGLERIAGPEALCLVQYLGDQNLSVRLNALRGLGRLSRASWIKDHTQHLPQIAANIRLVIHNSTATQDERQAALSALALWGDTQDATSILNAHYQRGGLVELSKAALYALVIADDASPLQEIQRTLHQSPSLIMRSYAAQLLVDPRLNWDHKTHHATFTERLKLLKQEIQKMKHQGDRRLADRLIKHYQNLSRKHASSLRSEPETVGSDLAPPVSEEEF